MPWPPSFKNCSEILFIFLGVYSFFILTILIFHSQHELDLYYSNGVVTILQNVCNLVSALFLIRLVVHESCSPLSSPISYGLITVTIKSLQVISLILSYVSFGLNCSHYNNNNTQPCYTLTGPQYIFLIIYMHIATFACIVWALVNFLSGCCKSKHQTPNYEHLPDAIV